MSSILQKVLYTIKSPELRFFMLEKLFAKNKLDLKTFTSFSDDRFFIYNVNDRFLASESINWFINYDHLYKECDSITLYTYKPKPGDTILDIGAGLGEEMIVLSNLVGQTGKVYSIEANPNVFAVLKQIEVLNNLTNTHLFNLAICEENGTIVLVDDSDSYLSASIGSPKRAAARSFMIDGVTLDSFIESNELDQIDLLKSNIEGAERFLVNSLSEKNIAKVKRFAIACHDFRYKNEGNEFFRTKGYIVDFLKQHGYQIRMQKTGVDYIDDWIYGER